MFYLSMNQKQLVWIIGLFSILYIFTLIYFSLQVSSLRQQLPLTLTPTTIIPMPTVISPTLITPTLIPTISVKPTSTPKPSTIISLKYTLPTGWSEVKLNNSIFSIGYDPAEMQVTQNDINGLYIRYNTTKYSFADVLVREMIYNGGSRHLALNAIIGNYSSADKLPGYREKEYKIGNSNCLFLIGIQPSQSLPTWGYCPISNTKAIFINMLMLDDGSIEKILKTVKFSGEAASTVSYQNSVYKFSFQYSNSYTLQDIGGDARSPDGNTILASFSSQNGKTFEVIIDSNPLTLNNLKKYAPTGQEDFPPNQSIEFTSPQFYYYGPGGGGVCYPDVYFTGNSNYTLILRFIGCDNDKTPPQYIKDIEHQILKSFRFY